MDFILSHRHNRKWNSKRQNRTKRVPIRNVTCIDYNITGFLAYLVYEPKSLLQLCFVRRVSCVVLVIIDWTVLLGPDMPGVYAHQLFKDSSL